MNRKQALLVCSVLFAFCFSFRSGSAQPGASGSATPTPTAVLTPTPTPTPTLTPSPTQAASGCDGAKVVYDHLVGLDQSFALKLSNGEAFTICIQNTAPAYFTYEIAGIKRPDRKAGAKPQGFGIPVVTLEHKEFSQIHDEKYSGYVVRIRKQDPDTPARFQSAADFSEITLHEATLLIQVETVGWKLEFAGAFTVSGLTSPVFAARTQEGESSARVVRDRDAEDSVNLGTAAFIHTYHARVPFLGLTFGLGVNDDKATNYFVGATYRMGDRAALTAGYNFGPISRLKKGLREGDQLANSNDLDDLGSRIDGACFFGLSYTFLGGADRFEKAFAGQSESAAQPTPVPAGPTSTPVPTAAIGVQGAVCPDLAPGQGGPFTLGLNSENLLVAGEACFVVQNALAAPYLDAPANAGGRDYFVLGNFIWEAKDEPGDSTKPILELSLRGNTKVACTGPGKCGPSAVGLTARYTSNKKNDHENAADERKHCGSGWGYHDRLPLGQLGPGDSVAVKVSWTEAGTITITTNGPTGALSSRICAGTVGFRQFVAGQLEGNRGWVTRSGHSDLDATTNGVKVSSAVGRGREGQLVTCPPGCPDKQ